MSPIAKGTKTDLLDEILRVWRSFDPVEGYAAGFKDCSGQLFRPDNKSKAELRRRIALVRKRLVEISDLDLRRAASKLLDAIRVGLSHDRPDTQVFACALAFWYSLLKDEAKKPFVGDLVKRATTVLQLESDRWKDKEFSGEVCKSSVDACDFLSGVLAIVNEQNPAIADLVLQARREVAKFRSLFPAHNSNNLDELFAFFEDRSKYGGLTPGYAEFLAKLYDYGASAGEIHTASRKTLGKELRLINQLLPKLATHLQVKPGSMTLGEIYRVMTEKYKIKKDLIRQAKKIMLAVNKFTEDHLQEIRRADKTRPEEAPDFLKSLITSGATLAINYLKGKRSVKIYVNSERNTSWLTLVNVLVHEATHAYHPVILTGQSLPALVRLRTSFATPISEAMAFHRELELFQAAAEARAKPRSTRAEKELLAMFDEPRFKLADDLNSFELETRIWRVMRALRAICDIEVNTGKKTYVEFIKWAVKRSGLDREFIHNECFPFLSGPGYTPSYSFSGAQYATLQQKAKRKQVSQREFNTKAAQMGLWPWTICLEKMKNFQSDSAARKKGKPRRQRQRQR